MFRFRQTRRVFFKEWTLKNFFLFSLFLILSSCAATRYGVIVGGQHSAYHETGDASALIGSGSLSFDEYTNSAPGFHVGFSEETAHILTKIYYFKNSYPEKEYSFDGTDYDTELSESGVKGTIAWKLGFFQPYIGITSYNASYTVGEEESSENYPALGFGADFEFQVSKKAFVYVGYGQDSHERTSFEGLAQINQKMRHRVIHFGLRYNFQEKYD